MTATGDCIWNVTNPNSWITITANASGSGNATVSFSVATNTMAYARTATLTIGGVPFTVAQGPQYAAGDMRGKSVVMNVQTGSGSLASTGKYLVVTSPGLTNLLQIVPISGPTAPTNGPYTFSRGSATTAYLACNGITTTLSFSSPAAGTFTATKPDGSRQTGTFTMAARSADFNGDGRYDLTWQSTGTRALTSWLMSGTNYSRSISLRGGIAAPSGWVAFGAADFDRDGQSDLVFQTSTGAMSAWLMKGTNWVKDVLFHEGASAGLGWKAVSTADFSGNGDGRLALWTFTGTNYASTIVLRNGQSAGTGWRAFAAADFNFDRQTDILFQQDSGAIALWLMNGPNVVTSGGFFGTPILGSGWRVAGAGDFNEDGRMDIFFQNTDGRMMVWLMNGRSYVGTVLLRNGLSQSYGQRCVAPK